MPVGVQGAFDCQREGCGLPLFMKGSDGKFLLYHVVLVIPDPKGGPPTRHLRLSGRNGCASPATLTQGLPWDTR